MISSAFFSSSEYVNQRHELITRKMSALKLKSVVPFVAMVFKTCGVLFKKTKKTPKSAATLAAIVKL